MQHLANASGIENLELTQDCSGNLNKIELFFDFGSWISHTPGLLIKTLNSKPLKPWTLNPKPQIVNPRIARVSKTKFELVFLACWPNPGPECLPVDWGRRDVEFAWVVATVTSVAASFVSKLICWNLVNKIKKMPERNRARELFRNAATNGGDLYCKILRTDAKCRQVLWPHTKYSGFPKINDATYWK